MSIVYYTSSSSSSGESSSLTARCHRPTVQSHVPRIVHHMYYNKYNIFVKECGRLWIICECFFFLILFCTHSYSAAAAVLGGKFVTSWQRWTAKAVLVYRLWMVYITFYFSKCIIDWVWSIRTARLCGIYGVCLS